MYFVKPSWNAHGLLLCQMAAHLKLVLLLLVQGGVRLTESYDKLNSNKIPHQVKLSTAVGRF